MQIRAPSFRARYRLGFLENAISSSLTLQISAGIHLLPRDPGLGSREPVGGKLELNDLD